MPMPIVEIALPATWGQASSQCIRIKRQQFVTAKTLGREAIAYLSSASFSLASALAIFVAEPRRWAISSRTCKVVR